MRIEEGRRVLTKDEIRERLRKSLSALIGDEVALEDTDNLLKLGLESLPTMRLLAEWIKQGYRVSFGSFMRSPTIAQWADMLYEAAPGGPADDSADDQADGSDEAAPADSNPRPSDAADFEPFDLTDVQYAYWIGRGREQQLGGVGCHGYVEIEAGQSTRHGWRPVGTPCCEHTPCSGPATPETASSACCPSHRTPPSSCTI